MHPAISVQPGSKVTINGIDAQRIVDMAAELAQRIMPKGTPDEMMVAIAAARLLEKMHRKGYTKEQTRKAVWQCIVDKAHEVKHGSGQSEVGQGSERQPERASEA